MKSSKQQFYYKNNRLQQLRGFCYAAQHGNISRAAESMGLSQSSVSLQIKSLEEDLGYKLFHRNGPHITLTHEGDKLLQFTLPMVDSIERLPEIFRHELEIANPHQLRIATNNTGKNYILPGILKLLLEKHPNTIVEIHIAEHHESVKLLQSGTVDLALLPKRRQHALPKNLKYHPILYCTPSLITLHGHPLAGRQKLIPAEISRYPLILPEQSLQVIDNLTETFSTPQSPTFQVKFANAETGREYIEAGLFITISSDVWIKKNDILVATPLSHLFEKISYGLVHKHRNLESGILQRFVEAAKQVALDRNQAAL